VHVLLSSGFFCGPTVLACGKYATVLLFCCLVYLMTFLNSRVYALVNRRILGMIAREDGE
jgi:hypothetical protein